ncbi:MAG TPA: hypothetical protein VG755_34015 [Nannocystaceae bacterium]|nr:hypothetical protein [Nannocystaceae bacterium]
MLRRIVPCLAVLLAPLTASAANGNKPRIPVVWSAAECGTVIDRSTTSVVHFEYTVPEEDLGELTMDEVDDSRRQQFFAFKRLDFKSSNSSPALPRWITQSDIDRAAMVDPMVAEMIAAGIAPEEILETGARFDPADWTRITPDDARVPISDAQAAMGVDWDVSAVAPGAWTIWGYTWEPTLNYWSARPGFVKIVESAAQADAAGPAIALLTEAASTMVTTCEPHALMGCVDAPAGSTVTLEWGVVEGSVEPDWQAVVEDEAIATGPLALDLVLPATAAEATGAIKLRVTVTDPSGKQYVAYSQGVYQAIAGADECEADSASDGGGDGGGDDGCCSIGGAPPSQLFASVVLFALLRRRSTR